MSNRNLRKASRIKNDEFYTRLEDIENELRHYKEHFKDKTIFCNCDDPFESNFVKYFALNFNHLGLKKLIATCYATSPVAWGQLSLFDINTFDEIPNSDKLPYKIEITVVKDFNQDGATDLLDIEYLLKNKKNTLTILESNGDFRSKESLELLKEADIVVTNPPFSLFRDYLEVLFEYNKKLLILGNINALTYKEVFRLFKSNNLWLGYNTVRWFYQPDGTLYETARTYWYTNLDHNKRHEELILYKTYNEKDYPKYDNYDAINVDKTQEIPLNYSGYMGVPITFMDKYNPAQFDIYGIMNTGEENEGIRYKNTPHGRPVINGKEKYLRILIKHKKIQAD